MTTPCKTNDKHSYIITLSENILSDMHWTTNETMLLHFTSDIPLYDLPALNIKTPQKNTE